MRVVAWASHFIRFESGIFTSELVSPVPWLRRVESAVRHLRLRAVRGYVYQLMDARDEMMLAQTMLQLLECEPTGTGHEAEAEAEAEAGEEEDGAERAEGALTWIRAVMENLDRARLMLCHVTSLVDVLHWQANELLAIPGLILPWEGRGGERGIVGKVGLIGLDWIHCMLEPRDLAHVPTTHHTQPLLAWKPTDS